MLVVPIKLGGMGGYLGRDDRRICGSDYTGPVSMSVWWIWAPYLHSAIAEDLSKEVYVLLGLTINKNPKMDEKWSDKDQVTSTENENR